MTVRLHRFGRPITIFARLNNIATDQTTRQPNTVHVKTDEIQPRSRNIRAARFCYYASLAVGFPLWLLTTFVLIIWVGLGILPPADIGPIEMSSPSALQTGVLRGAAVLFFVVYPLSFLWAYRLNHQPRVVFAVMLLPVLTFVYALACFPAQIPTKRRRLV